MEVTETTGKTKHIASFIISVDFELFWGVLNTRTISNYGKNILGARSAIPGLLKLFETYEVRSTWAVVGMLLFDNKTDLIKNFPEEKPTYRGELLSPYDRIGEIGSCERDDPYHYGRSLAELIVETPGAELASHTFSHYFCLAAGQTAGQFRSDLQASVNAIGRMTDAPRAIVFPRNQVNVEYLPICCDLGFEVYRGNPNHWAYNESGKNVKLSMRRIFRGMDTYIPLSGHNGFGQLEAVFGGSGGGSRRMVDAPASRFFRPTIKMSGVGDALRRRRIKVSMDAAFESGLSYHLWFHPHNFGANPEENLNALEDILRHFSKIRETNGVQSRTMTEHAQAFSS